MVKIKCQYNNISFFIFTSEEVKDYCLAYHL